MAVKSNVNLCKHIWDGCIGFAIATVALLMALLLSTKISLAAGDHYFVAPNGDDKNSGAINQPLRTIQHAMDQAQAGDTVYVRQGIYAEAIQIENSGTPTLPLTLATYPGERPVIDGHYLLPPAPRTGWVNCNDKVTPAKCFQWLPLVHIMGDHIVFEGFEIRQSTGRGLVVARTGGRPSHIVIRNTWLHDNRMTGVLLHNADNITFEGNKVWHSGDFTVIDGKLGTSTWPVAVSGRATRNVIFRNNQIFNNWGEGLDTGVDSTNVLVENNELYDNYALQLYIHRSVQIIAQRNLVYCTDNTDFWRKGNLSPGIVVNNERGFASNALATDITIRNNVVIGCQQNIAVWGGGHAQYGVENLTIAYNTLINARTNRADREPLAIYIAAAAQKNIQIHHNIILQEGHLIVSAPQNEEVLFYQNAWLQPPAKIELGQGDLIGDLKLASPFAPLTPGRVEVEWYKPLVASPVITAEIGPFAYFQGHD